MKSTVKNYTKLEILNGEQRCNFLGSPSRELLDLYASSIDSEYSYSKRQRNYDIAVSEISDFELRQDDKVMVKKRLPAYSHDLVNIAGLLSRNFSREKINIPIYQTEDKSLNIANLYPKKYWLPPASFNDTLDENLEALKNNIVSKHPRHLRRRTSFAAFLK